MTSNIYIVIMINVAPRRIVHLMMDAYYASAELLLYLELSGLPVVIGERLDHKPAIHANGSMCFTRLRKYIGRGVRHLPTMRV